jgi:tetratricopeptide (TPR) repeat protein
LIYWYQEGVWLREHQLEDMRYAGGNADVQNDFLQARLETGWLGLAAVVAVLAWWARIAIAGTRADDPEQRTVSITALGGVLALLTVAMVESCFQHPETRLLIWLWMAAPVTFHVSQEPTRARMASLRSVAAMALMAVFAWSAGRVVLSRYWTEHGLRDEFTGRFADAVADDRRAIDLDPTNREAHFHLGRALWRAGDLRAAVRSLDDAVRRDCDPRVYEMRIRILYYAGLMPEAVRRANEAVRIFPWAGEMQGWLDVLKSRMVTGAYPPLPPKPEQRP